MTDASIAMFTRDAGETVLRGGTRLSDRGRDYVTVIGTAATVTVSGDEVRASGDAANSYRVLAPQTIVSVLVNGAPAPACRDGNYLVFPCTSTRLTFPGAARPACGATTRQRCV
jgi:hypothetical protein